MRRQQNIFKTNKKLRLKERRMITKAALLVGAVIFLFTLTAWGAHHERVLISNIYIEGNKVIVGSDIQDKVREKIEGSYFWVFPQDNIFIFPRKGIKEEILDAFKRVYYVKIKALDFNSISINVKERTPYALWCEMNTVEGGGSDSDVCYFLDDKGFVFTESPVFSDNVYFTVHGELESGESGNLLGGSFLGEERFVRMMQLRALLAKEGVEATHLISKEDNDFEFHIKTGGVLLFNEDQKIEKLIRDLVVAMEVKKNEGREIFENLEYIDMRFNNKVLFKFSQ